MIYLPFFFPFCVGIVGYQLKVCPDSFAGASKRHIEEEITKKVDAYVNMLLQSAEVCEDEGVINTCSFIFSIDMMLIYKGAIRVILLIRALSMLSTNFLYLEFHAYCIVINHKVT